MLFFTIKHYKSCTLTNGHGAGVTVWRCMRMEMGFFCCCFFVCFFLLFDPAFFPPPPPLSLSLSLSPYLSPFSSTLSCAFCMLGHSSRAWLVLPGVHYGGTTVNRTLLVRKFDHFSLTSEAPFGPYLDTLERPCSYYYYPKYYRIKWY